MENKDWIKKISEELQERRERLSTPEEIEKANARKEQARKEPWWRTGGESTAYKMNKEKVTCPECGEVGPRRSMYRYHFDNCGIPQDPFGHLSEDELKAAQRKGAATRKKDLQAEAQVNIRRMYFEAIKFEKIQVTKFMKHISKMGIKTNVHRYIQDSDLYERVMSGKKTKYYLPILSCKIS